MRFVQVLLHLAFLPSFINAALTCESGGSCYLNVFADVNVTLGSKTCDDACVYFKCFVGDYKIMEGGGCYEDFINTCKYADFELKNQISHNIKNYSYHGHSLTFASCSDKENCAKKMFDKLVGPDKYRDSTFIFAPIYALIYKASESCAYDVVRKSSLSKVKCETKGWCENGKGFEYFDIIYAQGPVINETKTCDACVMFVCTIDGSKIMIGSGCQDDYERICKNVATNIKKGITENIKDYFYLSETLMIATCSDSDNCQENAFKNYMDVNYGAGEKPFYINRQYNEACVYEPLEQKADAPNTTPVIVSSTSPSTSPSTSTSTSPSTSTSITSRPRYSTTSENKLFKETTTVSQSSCQAKELNLLGMIIFGFILIYLW